MNFIRSRSVSRLINSLQRNFLINAQRQTRHLVPKNSLIQLSPESGGSQNFVTGAVLWSGFLSLFRRSDDQTPEDKMVMTIKRSILCIQKQEYDKAEQMLHLALRMAQDLHSKDGITYVYDVMANLAMEREQFQKAEKLFADVIKRLFADGHGEDSNQVLHINAKIAHMAQLEGNLDKATQGFQWTLHRIEQKMKKIQTDEDLKQLWGLTKNWYGEVLMKKGKFEEAKQCLLEAYNVFIQFHGKLNQEAVTILNNLSVACTKLDDYIGAKKFLEEGLEVLEQLPELPEIGIFQANLGLIYLREGMIEQAKQMCSFAYKMGKKHDNEGAIQQADYCLKAINEVIQKKHS